MNPRAMSAAKARASVTAQASVPRLNLLPRSPALCSGCAVICLLLFSLPENKKACNPGGLQAFEDFGCLPVCLLHAGFLVMPTVPAARRTTHAVETITNGILACEEHEALF